MPFPMFPAAGLPRLTLQAGGKVFIVNGQPTPLDDYASGVLRDLAKIVRDNNLTLTTLLVVGDAIGNREGLSRLYAHEFKHLFRK